MTEAWLLCAISASVQCGALRITDAGIQLDGDPARIKGHGQRRLSIPSAQQFACCLDGGHCVIPLHDLGQLSDTASSVLSSKCGEEVGASDSAIEHARIDAPVRCAPQSKSASSALVTNVACVREGAAVPRSRAVASSYLSATRGL